jgi:hypothetical protein
MKPSLVVKKSRSCTYRCLFFSGLVAMSLLFTILFTRIQPNLLAASKIQLVDRASNVLFSVSANEFHLGPVDDGDGDGDDDRSDVVALAPTDAGDATTRDISLPKSDVKGIRTNTGRPPLPDSVKPFQVDAFEALRMYGSATTLPTTDGNNRNNRKEKKDKKERKRKKKEEKARPQRNKKAANNNRAKGLPQVAWIMSFGGSVS